MTTKVTKESLAEKIKHLELCALGPRIGLSINEEYQLEAYRILLELMPDDVKKSAACGSCIECKGCKEDDQHAHMVD